MHPGTCRPLRSRWTTDPINTDVTVKKRHFCFPLKRRFLSGLHVSHPPSPSSPPPPPPPPPPPLLKQTQIDVLIIKHIGLKHWRERGGGEGVTRLAPPPPFFFKCCLQTQPVHCSCLSLHGTGRTRANEKESVAPCGSSSSSSGDSSKC